MACPVGLSSHSTAIYAAAVAAAVAILEGHDLVQRVVRVVHCQPLHEPAQRVLQPSSPCCSESMGLFEPAQRATGCVEILDSTCAAAVHSRLKSAACNFDLHLVLGARFL